MEVSLDALPAGKTYTFTGLKIRQKERPLTNTGTIYIDNVLVYDNTLTSITSETVSTFSFSYIAETNEVVANSEEIVCMKLYSLSGKLLRYVDTSRMSLADCQRAFV